MMRNSTKTEFELISECKKGIRKSQKEFYEIYSPKLFSICLKYSDERMLAEDILQEAFLKIFSNLHQYRGDGSLEGWLRRITVNAAIECLRHKKRNIFASIDDQPLLECNRPTALDELYHKELMNQTTNLSFGYQQVFNLYAIEGYSHKEISEGLNISESTSKSQYSRAKNTLRQMIG